MLSGNAIGGSDDAIAIVRADGSEATYGALRAAIERVARALRERGRCEDHAIAVAVADPAGFIVAALGAWQAGACVVPIDSRGGASALRAVSRARVASTITAATLDGAIELADCASDPRTLDARVRLLLFTSGSSAEPKGVLLSGAGIDANVRAILEYLPIADAPRTAVVVPLAYSYGFVGQVLTTLRVGGTLVLLGDVAYPALQVEAIGRFGAQGLSSVPASLRMLARATLDAPRDQRPTLRYVASAGGTLDGTTRELVGAAWPGAQAFNQYGLTEASPRVSAISDDDEAFARGSVGRAVRGVEVWAVSLDGARLGPGVEGEIVVRGESVMLGYLDDDAGTARVLSKGGALRTGDAGWIDEAGRLFVSGRTDGVVKCAGERVSVEEVAAVLRRCEGVRDACVVAVPHPELGATLCAYVEATGVVISKLRAFVREELPPAKRPSRFVALDALPRTANGKVALEELGR